MRFLKAFLAVVVSVAGALVTALGTGGHGSSLGSLDATHWLLAIGTVLGSGGLVYIVSNLPAVAGQVAKAIVAFLSAGIASLVVALADNVVTQAEWITAFSAAVLATGFVYQARNSP